jgi:hypothetical protein
MSRLVWGTGPLRDLAGQWELTVDLPGAEDVRAQARFGMLGEVLVQRTVVPVPEAPDSCCLVVTDDDGATIDGEWQNSDDGQEWTRDFGLTYRRRG